MRIDQYREFFKAEYMMGPNCLRLLDVLLTAYPLNFNAKNRIEMLKKPRCLHIAEAFSFFMMRNNFVLAKYTLQCYSKYMLKVSEAVLWSSMLLHSFTLATITFSLKGNSDLCCKDTNINLYFQAAQNHICAVFFVGRVGL